MAMNIGLRYEVTSPVTEPAKRMANLDIGSNSVVLAKPGSLQRRALAEPDLNNFGPRFGLAYQLSPKTVIRTGYGVFYTLEDAGHHNPLFNPPFSASFSFPSNLLTPDSALRPSMGFPPVALPADFCGLFLNINGRPRDSPAAHSQQWNFSLYRQFGPIHLETSYAGNNTTN